MDSSATRNVQHEIAVDAPARRVYELIANAEEWPNVFDPTVHVERVDLTGSAERLHIWATANGTAKSWTSRRDHDAAAMSIAFRQEQSQHPVGGMGGMWLVQPLSERACRVRLRHDYFAVTDEAADLEWIDAAVERNSTAELAALRSIAESNGRDGLLTFADTVEVDGAAKDVYEFLNEAQLWVERLPHVARVSLQEETTGLQVLEMDTRTRDGSMHTTRSVRVCQPYQRIVYKQVVLPALMTLHTGRWLIEERAGGGLSVTSRHTVRINTARIVEVLGDGADVAAAGAFVQNALSANSLATLRQAKSYAEHAGDERATA